MTQDHDDLDYDAWGAPPAPDVTDAVIARARIPMSTATETVDAKRSTRTLLLAGGAIALSVAALVIAVMIDRSKQPPPAPSLADLRVEELEKKVDELEAAITKLNAIGADPDPDPAPPAAVPPTPPATTERNDPGPTPAACDAAALSRQGNDHYSRSQWGAALAAFEKAFACKQTKEAALLAALAACRTGRAETAATYFAQIDEQKRPHIQQVCLMKGIELGAHAEEPAAREPAPTKCGWEASHAQGKSLSEKRAWIAALQAFEQAYKCKAAGETAVLAALAACEAHRLSDAFRWYKKTPEKRRAFVEQACQNAGTDLLLE